jgi:hypothetical protein
MTERFAADSDDRSLCVMHPWSVGLWQESFLTREEVAQQLEAGTRWVVTYCEGGKLRPVAGAGPTLPVGVLERVPTEAAKRKLQRGKGRKTFFRVEVRRDESGELLDFVEDL